MSVMITTPVFSENRNCWRMGSARRAAFLIDAAAYYEAFAEAAEKAERYICILSWDINGLIRLRRDRPQETLRQFFQRLLTKRPELQIYILNWEFPLVYARDRELLPVFDTPWQGHPRLHFQWDRNHPIGACHHQKVAVIDDRIAFVGGLDFTDERWDMPCHLGQDRRRRGVESNDYYKPFHDTTMLVEGRVAGLLGGLARDRWRRAGGAYWWAEATGCKDLWPESVPVNMENVEVAIARTEPHYEGRAEVREVEWLVEDMLRAAEHTFYIENQYFTSRRAAEVIAERLQEPAGPEIIIVLPQGCTGWMEEATLGVLRARIIRDLKACDHHGRLHIYYPSVRDLEPGDYIKLHSKVMIADDRLVRIGSANLSNRSMGMDTECDLAIEAPDEAGRKAVAGFRNRLVAEHVGTTPERVAALFQKTGSLAETIEQAGHPDRRLVAFSGEVSPLWESVIPEKFLLDPEMPMDSERRRRLALAAQGKKREAVAGLLHTSPFWLANIIAFPILGLWLLQKHLAQALLSKSGHPAGRRTQ